MKSKYRFMVGLFAFALLAGCESQVDLNLDEAPSELVLISNFAPGQLVTVQVSKTRSSLSTEDSLYLENATVELYQGSNLVETLELVPGKNDVPPYYTTRFFKPSVNIDYTVHAEVPDFKAVSASSRIPASTAIRSLQLSNLNVTLGQNGRRNYAYDVSVVFDDPGEEKNFYHLNFYQQILSYILINGDTLITQESLQKIRFTSDFDDNSLIAYFQGGVLFDDAIFNGSPIAYSFPLQVSIDPRREIIGKMFAELRTVSEEYYRFHNSLSRQQTSGDGPFAEPVIIYDNIENGQGIFAGYNAAVDSVAIQF